MSNKPLVPIIGSKETVEFPEDGKYYQRVQPAQDAKCCYYVAVTETRDYNYPRLIGPYNLTNARNTIQGEWRNFNKAFIVKADDVFGISPGFNSQELADAIDAFIKKPTMNRIPAIKRPLSKLVAHPSFFAMCGNIGGCSSSCQSHGENRSPFMSACDSGKHASGFWVYRCSFAAARNKLIQLERGGSKCLAETILLMVQLREIVSDQLGV